MADSVLDPNHICSSFLDAARYDHSKCVENLLLRATRQQRGINGDELGKEEAEVEKETTDINIDERSESTGKNALMYASELGYTKTLLALLDGGAVVDAVSANGHTALMYAAANGFFHCVKILLERKADVHIRTHRGQTTALMLVDIVVCRFSPFFFLHLFRFCF